MTDPTAAILAVMTGLSAITLALFGFDYYSLIYALVGAMFALLATDQLSWARAVMYVLLSTLAGAVLGNLAAGYIIITPPSRTARIGLCLVGGLVAQAAASALIKAAPNLADLIVKLLEGLLRRITGSKS